MENSTLKTASYPANRRVTRPSTATRLASRCISQYLRSSPILRGKHALWTAAAKRFLVSEIKSGLWIRTSGLTDAEKKLFLRGSKEPRSVAFVAELLEADMVVFDVGANIGYYSLIVARCVGTTGQVHAFEPTPALAERIRLNAYLNNLTQVIVNEVAVSEGAGTASLHISREDPEANSLFNMESGTDVVSVSTTGLDAYSANAGISHVDLIKIDCEGSELSVLRGARELLSRQDAPVLLLECNSASLSASGGNVSDLCQYLQDASYECYCLEQLREQPHAVWNLLALKSSHTKARRLVEALGVERFIS
jgi:FkbM family methyltransferase